MTVGEFADSQTSARPRQNEIFMDGAGNHYVADRVNGTIRKVALANGSVTRLVGVAEQHGIKLGQLSGSRSTCPACE